MCEFYVGKRFLRKIVKENKTTYKENIVVEVSLCKKYIKFDGLFHKMWMSIQDLKEQEYIDLADHPTVICKEKTDVLPDKLTFSTIDNSLHMGQIITLNNIKYIVTDGFNGDKYLLENYDKFINKRSLEYGN